MEDAGTGVRGLVSLGDNPFAPYRARGPLTFTKFDIVVDAAGVGGNTVIELLKNAGVVATTTLAAAALQAVEGTPFNISLVDGDTIRPRWASIAPTTPPSTVTIAARV